MIDFENRGIAVFELDSDIWTNAQLSALAAKAFPKDPGKGSRQLDEALKDIAHKLSLLEERPDAAIRITKGFELAVFRELVDGGMKRCSGAVLLPDPGGVMVCTPAFIEAHGAAS